MPLKVGINDNVYIDSTSIDDKAVIAITFKEVGTGEVKEKKSLFAMAASDQVEEVDTGTRIMLFPPNPPKDGHGKSEEKVVEMLTADINKLKGQCLHILRGHYTTEQLLKKFDPFAGLNLTDDNYSAQVQKKEVLEGVQRNIGRVFIEMMKPHVGDPKKAFRLLLVRQSTDKHFATLRGKFLDDNPFWESMEIPKEASKLKFTDWEIANGFNDGTPSKKADKPAVDGTPATAPLSVQNVFGGS